MIVKIIRRETPYVQMDRRIVEDTRLSWKAKGIMSYLLSRPHDWEVVSADVTARSKDGRESTLAGMNELRELGYAQLRTERDDKGHVSGKHWVVFEEPQMPDANTIAPKTGKPDKRETRTSDKPIVGKPATTNKKDTNKNSLSKRASLEELKEFAKEHGLPESDGEYLFCNWEENGWTRNGKAIKNWKLAFHTWRLGNNLPSQKARKSSGFNKQTTPSATAQKIRMV